MDNLQHRTWQELALHHRNVGVDRRSFYPALGPKALVSIFSRIPAKDEDGRKSRWLAQDGGIVLLYSVLAHRYNAPVALLFCS